MVAVDQIVRPYTGIPNQLDLWRDSTFKVRQRSQEVTRFDQVHVTSYKRYTVTTDIYVYLVPFPR